MYKTKFTKGIHRLLMLLLCVSILSWPVGNVQAIGKTTAAVSKAYDPEDIRSDRISGISFQFPQGQICAGGSHQNSFLQTQQAEEKQSILCKSACV